MAPVEPMQISGSFITGLAVGYALKKGAKVILLVAGISLLALIVLERYDIVTLHESMLANTMDAIAQWMRQSAIVVQSRLEHMHVMNVAGILTGFVLGLKIA